MSQVEGDGAMNYLKFNELRYPLEVNFDLVNLQERQWIKVGGVPSKICLPH